MDVLENKEVLGKIRKIAQRNNIFLLILFGSRAKGTYTKKSDYDIAFVPDKNFSKKDEVKLCDELVKILSNEKIDLINISRNHDVKLRYEIFFAGVPLYEKEKGSFFDMRGKAYIDYMDFKRFTKDRLDLLSRDIEEMEI